MKKETAMRELERVCRERGVEIYLETSVALNGSIFFEATAQIIILHSAIDVIETDDILAAIAYINEV